MVISSQDEMQQVQRCVGTDTLFLGTDSKSNSRNNDIFKNHDHATTPQDFPETSRKVEVPICHDQLSQAPFQ